LHGRRLRAGGPGEHRGEGGEVIDVAAADVAAYLDWKSDVSACEVGDVPVRALRVTFAFALRFERGVSRSDLGFEPCKRRSQLRLLGLGAHAIAGRREFHLDDLGAHLGQHARAGRPGDELGEVEDSIAFKHPRFIGHRCKPPCVRGHVRLLRRPVTPHYKKPAGL